METPDFDSYLIDRGGDERFREELHSPWFRRTFLTYCHRARQVALHDRWFWVGCRRACFRTHGTAGFPHTRGPPGEAAPLEKITAFVGLKSSFSAGGLEILGWRNFRESNGTLSTAAFASTKSVALKDKIARGSAIGLHVFRWRNEPGCMNQPGRRSLRLRQSTIPCRSSM